LCGWIMFFSISSFAQITQVIRGTIVDQESQFPPIGVNVSVPSVTDHQMGTSTVLKNNFLSVSAGLGFCILKAKIAGFSNDYYIDKSLGGKASLLLNYRHRYFMITGLLERSGEVTLWTESEWSHLAWAILPGIRYASKKNYFMGEVQLGGGYSSFDLSSNYSRYLKNGFQWMFKTGAYFAYLENPNFAIGPYFTYSKGRNYSEISFMLTIEVGIEF
jgi:hypothetical protein